ncbi:MAG TPA: hypothetical protein VG318_08175 [Actinomycetota bacterium]|nr:hypothetical protein [Actinomycetota bacterium]
MTAVAIAALAAPAGAAPEPRCTRSVERVEHGTWTTTPVDGIEGAYPGWRMAADPHDPRLVVVADSAGVLVTRDGGCRWTRGVLYDDVAPEWSLLPAGAAVARGPRGRTLHVLALDVATRRAFLLSSDDDGRAWSVTEPPLEATGGSPAAAALAAEPSRSGRLYLHLQHRTTSGALLATDDSGATWEWSALTTFGGPSGICAAPAPCTAPPLLQAEAAGAGAVWGVAAASDGEARRLVRSGDAGVSWEDVRAPVMTGGPSHIDVVPGGVPTVLLLGDRGDFAVSRDGGASWEVGKLRELSEGGQISSETHDAAHLAGGRAFAALAGTGPGPWSGNVMLFDGREWENVAPEAYAGFDRKDGEGRPLFFTELTGSRGSFAMLSSRGLLATFRPGR